MDFLSCCTSEGDGLNTAEEGAVVTDTTTRTNPSPLDTANPDSEHILVQCYKGSPSVQDLKILSVSDPEMKKHSQMPPPPPCEVLYSNREKNYMTEEGK